MSRAAAQSERIPAWRLAGFKPRAVKTAEALQDIRLQLDRRDAGVVPAE